MADNIQRIEELKRELAGNPQSRQFYQLGELLRREGRNAEAAEVLAAGVAVHPRYVAAWVALGRAWLEIDRSADAALALESALALDRQNPVAWRLLGEAKLAAGDRWGGLEAMSKALELVPGDEVLMAAVEALAGQTAPPSEPVPLFSVPRPTAAPQPPTPVPPPASLSEAPEVGFIEPALAPLAPALLTEESAEAISPGGDILVTPDVRDEVETLPPAPDPFAMNQQAEPLGAAGDWDVFAEPVEESAEVSVAVADGGDVFAAAPAVAAASEVVEAGPNVEFEASAGAVPVIAEAPPAVRALPTEALPGAPIAPEGELPAGPPAAPQLLAEFPDETTSVGAETLAASPREGLLGAAEPDVRSFDEVESGGAEPLVEGPDAGADSHFEFIGEVPEEQESAGPASGGVDTGEGDTGAGVDGAVSAAAGGVAAPVWVDVDLSGDPYAAAPAAPAVIAAPTPTAPPDGDFGRAPAADTAGGSAVLSFQAQPEAAGQGLVAASAEVAESSGSEAGLFDATARPFASAGESFAAEESGKAAEQVWLPATMTMARLLIQQQQLDGAVEVLERVIAREPGNEEAADLLELVRDMMQPDTAPLPPLSLRSRKIAALQRWQASMTLGRERVAP